MTSKVPANERKAGMCSDKKVARLAVIKTWPSPSAPLATMAMSIHRRGNGRKRRTEWNFPRRAAREDAADRRGCGQVPRGRAAAGVRRAHGRGDWRHHHRDQADEGRLR